MLEQRSPPHRARLQPDVHAARHAGDAATATRSAWATTCRCPSATPRARRCSGRRTATAASRRRAASIRRLVNDPIYGYQRVNVADQRRDPNSLLNWTERIIRTRKECAEISWGDWTILPRLPDRVLGMRYDWNDRSTIVLHNFADRPCAVRLRVDGPQGTRLVNLLSQETQRRRRERPPPGRARAVRLSLVPRRRSRAAYRGAESASALISRHRPGGSVPSSIGP